MKKLIGLAVVMLLLCFMSTGQPASAAEVSVNKVAYVNAGAKSLVLKYEDFSDSGYTYTVKNVATGQQVASGSAAAKVNFLNIGLGSNYAAGARYKLVLKGKNGQSMTVLYQAGEAVSGLNAVKKSDDSLLVSWNVANGNLYHGYKIQLTQGSGAAIEAETSVAPGTANTKTIASSSLKNSQYKVHLIGYVKIGNDTYYGQGLTTDYDYVKKPGKVTGVRAVPKANAAKLSWNAVSGASYYTIYKSKKSSGSYKAAMTNITGTSATVSGLSGGKNWYFKVVAVGAAGSRKVIGSRSSAAKAKIPVVAGQVQKVKLTLNAKKNLAISWSKTAKASGYRVYYKAKGDLNYRKLGTTKSTIYSLDRLDKNTKYNIQVRAYTKVNGKKYMSSQVSKTITVTPKKYMSKNYDKLLANSVRTIGYVGTKKCIYTNKKYSKAVKHAFVNAKGYSSRTKYLIWISHYTQQVSIFEGSKGNWKMIRTFVCATGTAKNHSPIGTFKLTYKEPGWFYTSTKELYVSHFAGRNSFHTRPLWNSGAVQNPTIGRPASHGCIRCYNQDAKYIYDHMPIGTTVISY